MPLSKKGVELIKIQFVQCAGHHCSRLKWFLTIDAIIKCIILLVSALYVCDTL